MSQPAINSALETLAREVFAMFPTCVRCGERIERFEDADVRIFAFRALHRRCVSPSPPPTSCPP